MTDQYGRKIVAQGCGVRIVLDQEYETELIVQRKFFWTWFTIFRFFHPRHR